jgi:hypothetical protein
MRPKLSPGPGLLPRVAVQRLGGTERGGHSRHVRRHRLVLRQVAAEVFLTVKSIEANLSRIYHKLHVKSRTQLARALADSHEP